MTLNRLTNPPGRSLNATSLSDIPLHILRSELARRAAEAAQDEGSGAEEDTPTCGSQQRGVYNTPIHVFALFLILALSTLGITSPTFRRLFLSDLKLVLTQEGQLNSMLVSHSRPSVPWSPHSAPLPLRLAAFRHRCADCDGIRASAAHCVQLADESLSSAILERDISRNGRVCGHGLGVCRRAGGNVFRDEGGAPRTWLGI